MRLVAVALLFIGCAAPRSKPAVLMIDPAVPVINLDQAQLRACQSCRRDNELCQERLKLSFVSGGLSECVDQLMTCLSQQQLDAHACAGLN
jgi:hypothetical protein